MTDWKFAQREPKDQLAHIHHFSMLKRYGHGEVVEILITIHEYVSPPDPGMPFFAQGDKEMNQRTAPCLPFGWGGTLLAALASCVDQIRRFPYEPQA